MTVRVSVDPSVLSWAVDVAGTETDELRSRFPIDRWLTREAQPTLKQLQSFARATGVGFGYFLLPQPPAWKLPVPDFREGFEGRSTPSADLIAVISQSQRRQAWYRDWAVEHGLSSLDFVGSAATRGVEDTAADMRRLLEFSVPDRRGSWSDTRKALLSAFEAVGGLTVASSMVGNNTHRLLDEDEFRGFALVDDVAPLVFVNTHQTLNGQLFTLAHEFAHVWRGSSGIGDEDPRSPGVSEIERWCNDVASEFLVPRGDLATRYPTVSGRPLPELLDALARDFRCGTLVVLQALNRAGLRQFRDFGAAYDAEVARLINLTGDDAGSGGQFYNSQPFRIGDRLSRALVADTLEGRTTISEAMRLMSFSSSETFDKYVRELGAA